ncbi:MAG: penicillin-binding protein 2 [Elusimicrobiales bacterium]|jgi:cell division protein FtsI (penicillin-binding protein 3)
MTAKTLRTRIQFCLFIAAVPAVPIALRLFYLQTINHETLSATASREFNRTVSETGPRGRIFDSQGSLLAESIITWNCSLFKKELQDQSGALSALASALSIPKKELQEKFRKNKNFVVVKKGLDRAQAEAVKALKLKGVRLDPEQTRYYPSGNLARNILGVVGADKGLTGIELLYNKVLTGKVLRREIVRDNGGKVIYKNELDGEAAPMDIYLTIDKNIQFFSQEAIKKYAQKNRSDLAMVLVQDPGSGRILAMATYPETLGKIEPVEWVYEPGSTFKTVTVSAALEKNTAAAGDSFYCENGSWALNGKVTIHDHEPEKTLSLSGVMERSSNIGAAKIGLKLGLENYYLYTKAFGFGTRTGLGFPGESPGILRPMENYRTVDLAVGSYGHGIGATPLQVINAYSAVANGGELLETRLVDRITDAGGTAKFKTAASVIRRVISKGTDALIKEILLNVVDSGTGKNAGVLGYLIAGKTGTSKKIDPRTGKYITNKTVASFCGFFPADKPQYTILVILDNPKTLYYGGETAAPAFQEIAKKIITLKGIKPDKALIERKPRPASPVTD